MSKIGKDAPILNASQSSPNVRTTCSPKILKTKQIAHSHHERTVREVIHFLIARIPVPTYNASRRSPHCGIPILPEHKPDIYRLPRLKGKKVGGCYRTSTSAPPKKTDLHACIQMHTKAGIKTLATTGMSIYLLSTATSSTLSFMISSPGIMTPSDTLYPPCRVHQDWPASPTAHSNGTSPPHRY